MSLTSIERIAETIDRTIAPKIAGNHPSTVNPETNKAVNLKTIALTINRNKPKVIIVKGKVKKTKSGLINVLITPKTMAASRAETKLATWIPGTI